MHTSPTWNDTDRRPLCSCKPQPRQAFVMVVTKKQKNIEFFTSYCAVFSSLPPIRRCGSCLSISLQDLITYLAIIRLARNLTSCFYRLSIERRNNNITYQSAKEHASNRMQMQQTRFAKCACKGQPSGRRATQRRQRQHGSNLSTGRGGSPLFAD